MVVSVFSHFKYWNFLVEPETTIFCQVFFERFYIMKRNGLDSRLACRQQKNRVVCFLDMFLLSGALFGQRVLYDL